MQANECGDLQLNSHGKDHKRTPLFTATLLLHIKVNSGLAVKHRFYLLSNTAK